MYSTCMYGVTCLHVVVCVRKQLYLCKRRVCVRVNWFTYVHVGSV